jgi:hypothetical protein
MLIFWGVTATWRRFCVPDFTSRLSCVCVCVCVCVTNRNSNRAVTAYFVDIVCFLT